MVLQRRLLFFSIVTKQHFDSPRHSFTWICVGFIKWEVKQMKAFGDWTPFFGWYEMVEWVKALNLPTAKRKVLYKDRIHRMFIPSNTSRRRSISITNLFPHSLPPFFTRSRHMYDGKTISDLPTCYFQVEPVRHDLEPEFVYRCGMMRQSQMKYLNSK